MVVGINIAVWLAITIKETTMAKNETVKIETASGAHLAGRLDYARARIADGRFLPIVLLVRKTVLPPPVFLKNWPC